MALPLTKVADIQLQLTAYYSSIDPWVQILLGAKLRNNLWQVVHTYVLLSPSSITWYRPRGGDAVRLGRQPQAWRKVMAPYRRVDDL